MRGESVWGPGSHSMPSNLSSPLAANAAAMSPWSAARTFTQKTPARLDRRPRRRGLGRQEGHQRRVERDRRERADGQAHRPLVVHGGHDRHPGGEGTEHLAEVGRVVSRRAGHRDGRLARAEVSVGCDPLERRRSAGARSSWRLRSTRRQALRGRRRSPSDRPCGTPGRGLARPGSPRSRRCGRDRGGTAPACPPPPAPPRRPRTRRWSGPSRTSPRTPRPCTGRRGSAGRRPGQLEHGGVDVAARRRSGCWWSGMKTTDRPCQSRR